MNNSDETGGLVCPLCGAATQVKTRPRQLFRICGCCDLAFRPRCCYPDPATEKAQYDLHQNDPADSGYRAFLERCAGPVRERVPPNASGLDYGCGPGPAMPWLLAPRPVALYDPFYQRDSLVLKADYDFLVCTETAEHFHEPATSWSELFRLVRPGGLLAVMTRLRLDAQALEDWGYARDPTHVCLYAESTFRWLAMQGNATLERPHRDVALFRKAD